jgi:hypothetical protein
LRPGPALFHWTVLSSVSRGRGAELCSRLNNPTYSIGDFTRWKEHDTYQKALDRLLRDLRVEKA